MIKLIAAAVAACMTALAPSSSFAQDTYPSRAVRIVVPPGCPQRWARNRA